jgi:F-type H+-transporting ATPase subunit gamma
VDGVVLFYHKLISSSAYRPQTVLLWPVDLEWLQDLEKKPWPSRVLPTFTMPRERLFHALLSQHLFVSLFRAFAESLASENTSRLMSMQAAEDNIAERLRELKLTFNQLRQSSITEELFDIMAGFEALSNKNV